jgi:hypothetical protein
LTPPTKTDTLAEDTAAPLDKVLILRETALDVTVPPFGGLGGLIGPAMDNCGAVTMNCAVVKSPIGSPVTVTVYVSFAPDATVKDPDIVPPDTVHVGSEMSPEGNEDIEHPLSSDAKFNPETITLASTGAEVGDSVIAGETKYPVSVIGPLMVTLPGLSVPE